MRHGYAKSELMPTKPEASGSATEAAPSQTSRQAPDRRPLPPAAERALAEAEARRAARERDMPEAPKERNGPAGLDPTRYGDWEINGIASDF
jgi:hypothetical protein